MKRSELKFKTVLYAPIKGDHVDFQQLFKRRDACQRFVWKYRANYGVVRLNIAGAILLPHRFRPPRASKRRGVKETGPSP